MPPFAFQLLALLLMASVAHSRDEFGPFNEKEFAVSDMFSIFASQLGDDKFKLQLKSPFGSFGNDVFRDVFRTQLDGPLLPNTIAIQNVPKRPNKLSH